jgi:hypothetical protein
VTPEGHGHAVDGLARDRGSDARALGHGWHAREFTTISGGPEMAPAMPRRHACPLTCLFTISGGPEMAPAMPCRHACPLTCLFTISGGPEMAPALPQSIR